MKKGMRFLAVAALSVAMTTAFGQVNTESTDASTGSDIYQQDRSQSGQGAREAADRLQSGQGSQGMGASSAEAKVKSEVEWMKSEFNLTDQQEVSLHDLLLNYATRSAVPGADVTKLKEDKEKELKALIGEDNYKVYKEKKKNKDKDAQSGSAATPETR